MNRISEFIRENKNIYISLVKNDFKSRYNGFSFGIIWGVIQPLVTILVYWFVFQVGLRSGDRPDGSPYILWLICGITPWFFFSEAIALLSNVFVEYGYLVKKVQFRIELLPMVKIGSSLLLHAIFLLISTIVLNFYGQPANWYYFQLLYYLFGLVFLTLGLGLTLSSISAFFRDMNQIVAIFIQIGFWMIPIVWGSEILPAGLKLFFQLNPLYYIIEGYRETLLSQVPFWTHPVQTLYFWALSLLLFGVGIKVFRRLKPSFSDVI